jgi:hypothetical protein
MLEVMKDAAVVEDAAVLCLPLKLPGPPILAWKNFDELQPQIHFSTHLPTRSPPRRRPPDQHLSLATGLHPNVLSAGQGHLDARPHSSRTVGASQCRGVVRMDRLRNFGGIRNLPSLENAADTAAGDLLQSAMADSGGVSAVAAGHTGGLASGRHHLGVLVGGVADCCCALGVCGSDVLYVGKR